MPVSNASRRMRNQWMPQRIRALLVAVLVMGWSTSLALAGDEIEIEDLICRDAYKPDETPPLANCIVSSQSYRGCVVYHWSFFCDEEGDFTIVYFAPGSAALEATAKKSLDNQAAKLIEVESVDLLLSGRIDDTEAQAPDHVRRLAMARANAVKAYLVGKGIERERLSVFDGTGWAQPGESNDPKILKEQRVVVSHVQ